jgi:DNA polymerase (family 10)
MFSINPDAHSIDELDLTRWGVLMARKGGIPPERVLNSLDLKRITIFRRTTRVPNA